MNYYNPYFYQMMQPQKVGLLTRLFGNTGVSISNFLNGTQRVLNIANQTIPLVKQVKPMIGNTKTMLKVMNEFKRNDKKEYVDTKKEVVNDYIEKEKEPVLSGPTFFIK